MSRVTSSSSKSTVGIQDTFGDPIISTNGALNVSLGASKTIYAEATAVPTNIETTIVTYTTTSDTATLLDISASGQNIGEIRIYKNGDVVDKQYLYYTSFNLFFNFNSLGLIVGDTISVKGLNIGEDVCNFNAKIQVIEVDV